MEYYTTRLQPMKSYPTYQFYARTNAKKLPADDVFRICILETFRWLRARLASFGELPEEICTPEPEDYAQFTEEDIRSFSVGDMIQLDVVYVESKGIWSFQLKEQDMGANIGKDNERPPVSGRTFTTEITFRRCEKDVEAGFCTTCTEPAGTEADCEVFRPMIVRVIAENPEIGFAFDSIPLDGSPIRLSSRADAERFCDTLCSPVCCYPVVLVTESPMEEAEEKQIALPSPDTLSVGIGSGFSQRSFSSFDFNLDQEKLGIKSVMLPRSPKETPPPAKTAPAPVRTAPQKRLPGFDDRTLSAALMGYALVCYVPEKLVRIFSQKTHLSLHPGDILVLTHTDVIEQYPYRTDDREELLRHLKYSVRKLLKRWTYTFGELPSHADAKLLEYHTKRHRTDSLAEQCEIYRMELNTLRSQVQELSRQNADMQKTAETLRITQKKLRDAEREIEMLKQGFTQLREELEFRDDSYKRASSLISFYKERAVLAEQFPSEQGKVCDWAASLFSQNLIIAPRARSEMRKYSGSLDLAVLCDGILYLNAYAQFRRQEIDGQALSLYAERFGWEVSWCGKETLRIYHDDYQTTVDGRPISLPLHIKRGIDSKVLVRIYFNWDERTQKIIIGSMPEHLPTEKNPT